MFEDKTSEISGYIFIFIILACVGDFLFGDTPFWGFLANVFWVLFAIGIVVVILYLLFAVFIDLNNRKKLLESQELKIANLERENTELEMKLNPKKYEVKEAKYSKKVKKEIELIKSLGKHLR